MTKVEALHEVITALGGTPTGTTVAECIAEIASIEGGAPTTGASTSEAIHELALALGYEPGPTPPVPTTYTVSFNLNGGTGTTPDPITVNAGESVTLPDYSGVTKEGYTCLGWEEPTTDTPLDSPYTPAGDITLYLIWYETVTLTFDPGSGYGESFTKEVPRNVPTALPTWAECEEHDWMSSGRHVDGWYTSEGSESDPAADPYTATSAETFYAIWVSD